MPGSKTRLTLRQARLKQSFSLLEFAEHSGVALTTIMKIEAGSQPQMRTMRKLAEALGCAPQDIAWPGDPFAELDELEDGE